MNNPTGGGNLDELRSLRVQQDLSVHWDLSDKPFTNDRKLKTGRGLLARGGAVDIYDDKSGRFKFYDGTLRRDGEGSNKVSLWIDEPDNWVLRFHDPAGEGDLSTWAARLISDHTHTSQEAKNRGTMVIDQDKDQLWGWLSDIALVVEPPGGTVDEELHFNGAGFLSMLDEELGPGGGKRGALAIPFPSNGGFVTAGSSIGQLQHVLTFAKPTTATPGGGGGGPGQTVVEGEAGAGGGRPTTTDELLLRGDVGFNFPEGVARLQIDVPDGDAGDGLEGEEIRRVFIFIAEGGNADDGLGPTSDPKSNFEAIPKKAKLKIGGWVRVPQSVEENYTCALADYSYHSEGDPDPDDYASGSGGKAPDVEDEGTQPDGNKAKDANGNDIPNEPTIDQARNPIDHVEHGMSVQA